MHTFLQTNLSKFWDKIRKREELLLKCVKFIKHIPSCHIHTRASVVLISATVREELNHVGRESVQAGEEKERKSHHLQ